MIEDVRGIIMTATLELLKKKDYLSAFLLSYGIWFVIDWYDCFFGDWVLFANIKKIRLREQNIWIKNITRRNITLFILL